MQWHGVEVCIASDGSSGLEAFFETQPDVLLLDVGLPGRWSGFEVLEQIRRISDVPMLMLTAHGQELEKVRGLELGADDHITNLLGCWSCRRECARSCAGSNCARLSAWLHAENTRRQAASSSWGNL
jgi:PleD family two-component response regulator